MNRFEFNTGDHKEEEEKVLVGRSYGKEVLYRFRKNKGAWISFFIIILLIVIALAAPAVSSYSYKEVHSEYSNLPPRIPGLEKLGIFDGVSHGQNMYEAKNCTDKYFFFGTDNLGRDIWTRVWEGTRISLLIAALAVMHWCDLWSCFWLFWRKSRYGHAAYHGDLKQSSDTGCGNVNACCYEAGSWKYYNCAYAYRMD